MNESIPRIVDYPLTVAQAYAKTDFNGDFKNDSTLLDDLLKRTR